MNRFILKAVLAFLALAVFVSLAPMNEAQTASSLTQVSTIPNGLQFTVDNQVFSQTMGAIWPAGSKHSLYAIPIQYTDSLGTQNVFTTWQWTGGPLPGNPTVVTADPTISSYQAVFAVSYALNLLFSPCPSGNCPSPGTVYVNGVPFTHDTTVYVPAGSPAVLQAFPGNGYVFGGWGAGLVGQTIQGFQKTITVTQPTSVYPQFQVARTINLTSVPSGLQIVQDRTPITTPAAVQWGYSSVHTLGVVSPQPDIQGLLWVFSSWSDNGASTHSYTVAPVVNPDTVTATFIPGALVTFATNPQGLNLSVDGRINWPTYNFTWGVGETHTVAAPAQQTDAQGHIWAFSSWSNGGPASQSVTVPAAAATAGLRMTATFTPVGHLTVSSPLSGLPVTINGSACVAPCDFYAPGGTQVDVAVPLSVPISPGSRQDFGYSWSVNGAGAGSAPTGDLILTLGSNAVTVTPVYHMMNLLTAGANPSAGANLSLQPASSDGFYDSQATVTVKASVLPGYRFRGWSGDLTGPTPTGSVAMSAPRVVTALLDPVPYIMPAGVANGAGVTPQAVVAPGSVVSAFGANLAPAVTVGPAAPMVQTLGGITARVGAQVLPLFFVSPTQINFQLPPDLPLGPQTLIISSQGQPDAQATFQVAADAPGIFPATVSNGVTFGIVTHADGSAVTSDSPAQTGETLTLLGTGFGPTAPARQEGFPVPASPVYALTDPATVQLGSASVTPSNAYALPGSVGVDAIQFVVPAGLPSGTNVALTVTINGTASNTVQLPIQ